MLDIQMEILRNMQLDKMQSIGNYMLVSKAWYKKIQEIISASVLHAYFIETMRSDVYVHGCKFWGEVKGNLCGSDVIIQDTGRVYVFVPDCASNALEKIRALFDIVNPLGMCIEPVCKDAVSDYIADALVLNLERKANDRQSAKLIS